MVYQGSVAELQEKDWAGRNEETWQIRLILGWTLPIYKLKKMFSCWAGRATARVCPNVAPPLPGLA